MKRIVQEAFFAIAASIVAAGCYPGRLTGNYDKAADIADAPEAIVAESGRTPEEEAAITAKLEKIAKEKEPVYCMNAGDKVDIRVYDHPDLCIVTKIGPDGMVGFAFIGQVKLGGLTIAEGSERIRKGLEPYVKNPVVSITILEVESETVTIAGSCAKPGVYHIYNSTHLADLYAMAGSSANRLFHGVNIDVADLSHSMFIRDGEVIPLDFHKAIDKGEALHNILLRKGDYIFIAQRMEASVIICGEVAKPHKRLFEPGMGLVDTLTEAGWMKDSHWQYVIIIRGGFGNPKLYKVDIDAILAGKRRNVPLNAGDIVYVPKDNISEYNVFVKKLMPTVQLINLCTARFSTINVTD